MRVLVTGGTGTTGTKVAAGLEERGHAARRASRSAPQAATDGHVVFDWAKPETHAAALDEVDAAYLVPPVLESEPELMMLPFIDQALDSGVRRFVLLSASVIPEGSPGVGTVHAALRERAPEWSVLQPSWFMQNFTGSHFYADSIRREALIATATGEAGVGFVDADDIAAVAVRALLDEDSHDRAHVITGPEALSYGDVARIVTEVTGRPIRHQQIDQEEARSRMIEVGMPELFAGILANLEGVVREGAEDRVTDTVERVTGKPPRSFRSHVELNAGAWDAAAERPAR